MKIAGYLFPNALALAPMAGVTDRVFRRVCRGFGASVTVGEMVSARTELRDTRKSRLRLDFSGEPSPRIIQIAGGDAADLAAAARINAEAGADIIDVNMGCPAKKVCRKAAGSALMGDIDNVGRMLAAVVAASPVPVTLKMRTGVSPDRINAVAIARMAENAGIAALAVHGRTRDQHYRGMAEYDTIAAVVAAVSIPVWANGDVDSPARAHDVLDRTGAAGLMIGRAACRRPWLFRELAAAIDGRPAAAEPDLADEAEIILGLVEQVHDFYGEEQGVRMARKHIGWLCERRAPHPALYMDLMTAASAARQIRLLDRYFDGVAAAA